MAKPRIVGSCSADNCNKPSKRRGMCDPHYMVWWHQHRRPFIGAKQCSVEGCGKPSSQKGWCAMHYSRWHRHGDLEADGAIEPHTCSVDGCIGKVIGHGYCSPHYQRWRRHGSPTSGRQPNRSIWKYLAEVVLPYVGDDCLIWPYTRNPETGYAMLPGKRDGSNSASRWVCKQVKGNPPTPQHHAAHECGNGSGACVSPGHLSWKTRSENEQDKIRHGTSNRGERCGISKLTEPEVREIKKLLETMSQEKIAHRFGVHRSTIQNIKNGSSWNWLE